MSVLVTGSAGFICSNFVLDWMAQCDEPVINPDALNAGNLENLASMQGDGRHTFVKDRPGHDRRYAIDAGKLERELGWKPAETSETGIRKTVCWYLGSQEWVRNVTSGECRNWGETQNAIEAAA